MRIVFLKPAWKIDFYQCFMAISFLLLVYVTPVITLANQPTQGRIETHELSALKIMFFGDITEAIKKQDSELLQEGLCVANFLIGPETSSIAKKVQLQIRQRITEYINSQKELIRQINLQETTVESTSESVQNITLLLRSIQIGSIPLPSIKKGKAPIPKQRKKPEDLYPSKVSPIFYQKTSELVEQSKNPPQQMLANKIGFSQDLVLLSPCSLHYQISNDISLYIDVLK